MIITPETHPHLIKENFAKYLEMGKKHLRSGPLALFRDSPYQYYAEREGITQNEDKSAYSFGRAAHLLILEGAPALWLEYVLIPEELQKVNKNTTEYQDWKNAQKKFILTPEQWKALQQMKCNVVNHESAHGLLSEGVSENTVRAKWMGRDCQVRIDHYNHHIVDLKTTRDLDWFGHDARKYGYNNQMAFYRDVYSAATEEEFPPFVYIIAVESVAPYRVGVWKLKDDWLLLGHTENVRAVKELNECEEFDHWPTRFETIRDLGFYEGRS